MSLTQTTTETVPQLTLSCRAGPAGPEGLGATRAQEALAPLQPPPPSKLPEEAQLERNVVTRLYTTSLSHDQYVASANSASSNRDSPTSHSPQGTAPFWARGLGDRPPTRGNNQTPGKHPRYTITILCNGEILQLWW